MNPTIALMEAVFTNPPKPFDPVNQTLKGWAVFCLRDRGFKIATFSPKADLVVEAKLGDFLFKVTQSSEEAIAGTIGWIVVAADGTGAIVVAPEG
jgi:hypothetical protein